MRVSDKHESGKDSVPPSKEVGAHQAQLQFREELDHLVHVAEITVILAGVGLVVIVVGLAATLVLTYY